MLGIPGRAQSANPSPTPIPSAAPAPPPCRVPIAVSLADRPGTGRTTSSGGSPCVVLPDEVVVESGLRRQVTTFERGSDTIASGPLTFVRVGVAKRVELGVAPPAKQSRAVTGIAPFDAARGYTDIVLAAKYLVLDTGTTQGSLGAAYSAPTGTGEYTAGAPTFSVSANLGIVLTSKLSFATSQIVGTAVGPDASGVNRTFFAYAPSFTLAYALDNVDTLLVQDALTSRQGPVLPAGSRGFVALQRGIGSRFAVDVDYEINLAPTLASHANAIGFGFVWIAAPGRKR
jgi:outer membrane putative beta-barrel porin/alpha-amylase